MSLPVSVCCLRVGQKYGPEYVHRLERAVRKNMQQRVLFYCATDDWHGTDVGNGYVGFIDLMGHQLATVPAPKIPIQLQGWWNKMLMFHPDGCFGQIKGRVLFLDIDVIITGPLDDLVNFPSDFAMMHDLQRPWRPASAVMLLEAGSRPWIWEQFERSSQHMMGWYNGDQDAIKSIIEENTRWTAMHYGEHADYFPQRWIKSYKHQAVNGPPKDCRIVAFHGVPRPHEITSGWVPTSWK